MKIGDTLARYVDVSDDLRGADLVVVAGATDLDALRALAPAAVVLVAGEDVESRCREVYDATLFPRGRVIGVGDPVPVAEAILFERDEEHEVVALADGSFGPRAARLGRGGIRALV